MQAVPLQHSLGQKASRGQAKMLPGLYWFFKDDKGKFYKTCYEDKHDMPEDCPVKDFVFTDPDDCTIKATPERIPKMMDRRDIETLWKQHPNKIVQLTAAHIERRTSGAELKVAEDLAEAVDYLFIILNEKKNGLEIAVAFLKGLAS